MLTMSPDTEPTTGEHYRDALKRAGELLEVEGVPEVAAPTPEGAYQLTVLCHKCTRWRQFIGVTELAAKVAAKAKGWKFVGDRTVCKRCPS